MRITIVIPCHNEQVELSSTIQSIRETAKDAVDIIVVDDASRVPILAPRADELLRNNKRRGVGPSRHDGLLRAKTDWVLLIDSHMRFSSGWLEQALIWLKQSPPNHLWCGACLAINARNPVSDPYRVYCGGRWNMNGWANNRRQVFEIVWNPGKAADGEAIPAMMGACYFIPRAWYETHQGLQHLDTWGGDEQLLSIKAYRSGGEVRFMEHVRIGHKFWAQNGTRPFTVRRWCALYNKLFLMHTLLPRDIAMRLEKSFAGGIDKAIAVAKVNEYWPTIEAERIRNESLLPVSMQEYADRFGFRYPP